MAWEFLLLQWIMTLHEGRQTKDCVVRLLAYWRLYTFNVLALVSRRFHGSLMGLLDAGRDKPTWLFYEALKRRRTIEWVAREVFKDFPWRADAMCQAIAGAMMRWRPIRRPRPPQSPGLSCSVSYTRNGRIKEVSLGMLQHIAGVYRRRFEEHAHLRHWKAFAGSATVNGPFCQEVLSFTVVFQAFTKEELPLNTRHYANEFLQPKNHFRQVLLKAFMQSNSTNSLLGVRRTVSEPRLVASDSTRERRRSRSVPLE